MNNLCPDRSSNLIGRRVFDCDGGPDFETGPPSAIWPTGTRAKLPEAVDLATSVDLGFATHEPIEAPQPSALHLSSSALIKASIAISGLSSGKRAFT